MSVVPITSQTHKFAKLDEKTGIFTSAIYPTVNIPDDLTIDQFMFDYTPEQAARGGPGGEGHSRPSPQGKTWLIDPNSGRSLTFEEARARTVAAAKVFQGHFGLQSEGKDAIVVYSPNDIDYPITCWGTFRLGGVISGANPSYTEGELTYQLGIVGKHYKLRGLVTHPASLPVALKAAMKANIPPSRILLVSGTGIKSPDRPKEILTIDEAIKKYSDEKLPPPIKLAKGEAKKRLAFLSFSSGTTGLPKACCIPHGAVISNVVQTATAWGDKYKTAHKSLSVLPFYHIYGLVVVLHAALYRGLTQVVVPKFELEEVLDVIIKQNIEVLFMVPLMIVLMTKHPSVDSRQMQLVETMQDILVGAAPMTQELVNAFRKRFPKTSIGQGYGMTETSTVITIPPWTCFPVPGSAAGVLAPNIEVKIHDFNNKPLGWGRIGEVISRSPSNAISYLDNKKATEETFDSEGYVHTGDEGYIDENGWLFVIDRRKELIKVKGNQVAPAELEGHLLGVDEVSDACVIGIPDEYAGEIPRAYIVPSAAAALKIKGNKRAEEELVARLKKYVADHKIGYKHLAGGVEFVDVIPKNASGKLLRRELRDRYKAQHLKAKI